MKTELRINQLFWGTLLVTGGALFLLLKFEIITSDISFMADFWPALLIIWGLIVIFKHSWLRPVLSVISAVLMASVILGLVSNIWYDDFNGYRSDYDQEFYEYDSQNFSEPLDSTVTKAKLHVTTGAAKLIMNSGTDKLFEGFAGNISREYVVKSNIDYDFADIEVYIDEKRISPFEDKFGNNLKLKLSDIPEWVIMMDVGATKNYLDFSDLKISKLELNTGASKTDIKIGNKLKHTDVEVNMGGAKLTLNIPRDSGCKLTGDMVLTARNMDGLDKIDSDYYVTPGFDTTKNKIYINIDGAVSKINIERY